MAMAAPPPELVHDAIDEILLRLPPDEPKWLFRAALACKQWLRTISDPAFLHRYRVFHGVPPLLGLIGSGPIDHRAPRSVADPLLPAFPDRVLRFVPTTAAVPAFPIPVSDAYFVHPPDCRHGRILIHMHEKEDRYYLVCDPITGDRHRLPVRNPPGIELMDVATAIFCAVAGCQHLDCHGSPFCVSSIFTDLFTPNVWATIYSSETGAWSALAASPTLDDVCADYGRGALVGEGIYFSTHSGDIVILKHDWRKNCLSVLKPPPLAVHSRRGWVALTVMKDTSLGLAVVLDSSLHLWSRVVGSEEDAEWVQCRVIDLGEMIPMANPRDRTHVLGFTEGVGVIFISTGVGLFMMELRSGRVKKIGKPRSRRHLSILPYMSFYTPGLFAANGKNQLQEDVATMRKIAKELLVVQQRDRDEERLQTLEVQTLEEQQDDSEETS